jgi:fructoselysine 6-kinase
MSRIEVATVGDNCIDRYLPPIGMSTVGGNALNVAVHLRSLGLDVAYFGAVGDDSEGRRTVDCLHCNGVGTGHLRVLHGRTAFTELDVDATGDRVVLAEDFGVCRGYRPNEGDSLRLRAMRHVHLGWLDDDGRLRAALVGAGLSVSQDLSVNAGAEGLAIAFASAGSSREQADALLKEALQKGARISVVTRGAQGSIASDGVNFAATGVTAVEVLDTTGAGDTFIAGFIDAHLQGGALQFCLEAGRDLAASTCRHLGGFPQEPERLPEA